MSGCPPFLSSGKEPARLESQSTDLSIPILAYRLRIHVPPAGYGAALEHNGDLYIPAITSFEPRYKLGNIRGGHNLELKT